MQPLVRIVEPSAKIRGRVRDLLRYRELIMNLVRKELRVKYKNSTLGFVWSMLNPALYLVIFWIVFTKFLPGNVPRFPIFLLSGLLAWNLWSAALGGSVTSLLGNANLVTKVYFPREVMPISVIGAGLMHFFFQLVVLVAALIAFRYPVSLAALILVPSALVVELLLLVGACLIVAVLNVYFRDVQHLLELAMLAWFWMTPIVYPVITVHSNLSRIGPLWRIYMMNPITHIVLAFQRGIYAQTDPVDGNGTVQHILIDAPVWWYLRNLGIVAAGATIVLIVGWSVFRRLESRLAEEL